MILTGYCRLGKDSELRYTQGENSTAVANLALAFNYGRKDADGKRATQWVDASLWGQRAEALIDYLLKGQGLDVVLEDVHIETYESNNGGGSKLVGRVVMIEFAGSNPNSQGGGNGGGQQQGNQRQGNQQRGGQQQGNQQRTQGNNGRTQQQGNNGRNAYNDAKNGRTQRAPAGGGFDEMDDDIPFN